MPRADCATLGWARPLVSCVIAGLVAWGSSLASRAQAEPITNDSPQLPPAPAAVPLPNAPGTVPLQPMYGPAATLGELCKALSPTAQCKLGPNEFARQWHRGGRPPFLAATTLSALRRLGRRTIETCHVAMQTNGGWYLSSDDHICQGQARGEKRQTSLRHLRWADELGLGVLAVYSEVDRTLQQEEHRWWGSSSLETNGLDAQVMWCGMGPNALPACTATLSNWCHTLEPVLQWTGHALQSTAPPEAAQICGASVLPAGSYALPFGAGAPLSMRHEEWSAYNAEGDPVPFTWNTSATFGPFPTLNAYCADPATYADSLNPPEPAESTEQDAYEDRPRSTLRLPDPQRDQVRCLDKAGPWRAAALRSHGPIRKVQLLSLLDSGGTIPQNELCRIAITTERGTYISEENSWCQGLVGPDVEVTTRATSLHWLNDEHRVFRLDFERTMGEGPQSFAQLCGLSDTTGARAAAEPRCSTPIPLACTNSEGTTVALQLKVVANQLTLTAASKQLPPEVTTHVSCEQLVGRYAMIW